MMLSTQTYGVTENNACMVLAARERVHISVAFMQGVLNFDGSWFRLCSVLPRLFPDEMVLNRKDYMI